LDTKETAFVVPVACRAASRLCDEVTTKKIEKLGKASSLPKPWKQRSLDQRHNEDPMLITLFRKMSLTSVFFDFFQVALLGNHFRRNFKNIPFKKIKITPHFKLL
jgi:hypothetical protein